MKRKKRSNNDEDNGFAAWGGYMEAKKSKLLEQFTDCANKEDNKKSNIFDGISIFVNGYTTPSADELKQLMLLHGGIYHHYHSTTKTKFIIASNLPDAKIKQLNCNQNIVRPEWILDSIKNGKLLDYTQYLLYSNCNRKQPKLNFEKIEKKVETENKVDYDNNSGQLSPDLFEKDETINIFTNFENTSISTNTNLQQSNTKLSETENSTRILSANNPKFLSEFYNNSRLHHISTLGAMFKQHISLLREQSSFHFPERQKLKDYINQKGVVNNTLNSSSKSLIMHIDMDCFFVSVGLRKRPDLKGLPVAVTHSKGGQEPSFASGVDRQAELDCYKKRLQDKLKLNPNEFGPGNMLKRLEGIDNQSMSEIASCSYEARKAGVKNGMFMGTALKLCPNLQTIPYDFDGYKEVATTLYNTVAEYTLNIEAVSCDEMFVDVGDLLRETNASVTDWASYIRGLIRQRTGCPCSTGFGANRLQARLATKTAKPDGQFHLLPNAVAEYMLNVKVSDLPGVGFATTLKLKTNSMKTCGELQTWSITKLRSEFGNKLGGTLYDHCRGYDNRPLVYEHERKSVSAEVNYGIRFKSNSEAETFFKQLATEVHTRLTNIRMKGKCITLKLMVRSKDAPQESSKYMGHGVCDHITKSSTLSTATSELDIIIREVLSLAHKLSIPPQELRGIGIQISRLEHINRTTKSNGLQKFLNQPGDNNKTIKRTESTEEIKCNEIQISHLEQKLANQPRENRNKILKRTESREELKYKTEKNKSPVKSNGVSRGRGRPSKCKLNKVLDNNTDLKKFLSDQNKLTIKEQEKKLNLNDIDIEVFKALPFEIQQEIFQEYPNMKNINLLENKCTEQNQKVETITKPSTSKNNLMFSDMNIKQVKSIIEQWVSSEVLPEVCDIRILGEYFQHLATNKKINCLFTILKFLYSEVLQRKSCAWHQAYFQVVDMTQQGMKERYGKNIWAPKKFHCSR